MYVVTQHTIHDRWKAVHATRGPEEPATGDYTPPVPDG